MNSSSRCRDDAARSARRISANMRTERLQRAGKFNGFMQDGTPSVPRDWSVACVLTNYLSARWRVRTGHAAPKFHHGREPTASPSVGMIISQCQRA
jgi:hypothetical protein